jgi:hypothetical protein
MLVKPIQIASKFTQIRGTIYKNKKNHLHGDEGGTGARGAAPATGPSRGQLRPGMERGRPVMAAANALMKRRPARRTSVERRPAASLQRAGGGGPEGTANV